jgi:hypothetical protein
MSGFVTLTPAAPGVQEDFLDANILLGHIVGWDTQKAACDAYMAKHRPRHTSRHVYKSARNVLTRAKQDILAFLVDFQNAAKRIDVVRVDEGIQRAVGRFCGSLDKNGSRRIQRYAAYRLGELRRVSIDHGSTSALATEATGAFDAAFDLLDALCHSRAGATVKRHSVPQDHGGTLITERAALVRAIPNGDDVVVVLDALYIKRMLAPSLANLVTTDAGDFHDRSAVITPIIAPLILRRPQDL